jgi:hypothetical protein
MKKLIDTNPYLRDPEQREKLIERSVTSSTGVEGIHIKKRKSPHEEKLFALLNNICQYPPVREYKFDQKIAGQKQRMWRFDFAYPEIKIAFEVEGGTWNGGRHVHPVGFLNDCIKYNEATRQGWIIFRLVPSMIKEDYICNIWTTVFENHKRNQ